MPTPIINSQMDSVNSTLSDLSTDLGALRTAMKNNLAHVDGAYEGMTVGYADQLVSTVGVDDQVPYNFRTAGGANDIGSYLDSNAIVGGTVAWNQLVQASREDSSFGGLTFTRQSTYSTKVSGTTDTTTNVRMTQYTNMSFISGHKYFISWGVLFPSGCNVFIHEGDRISASDKTATIWACGTTETSYPHLTYLGNTAIDVTYTLCIIDLTLAFGSTIADYLYTLESGTAGAGVAWFKKLFPKPYYAYNAGTLLSVNASSHDTIGFNQWDEEWELGNIDSDTGNNTSSSSRFRSKNYIPALPNATYYFYNGSNATYALRFYDASKAYIGAAAGQTASMTFTTPTNCYYMRFVSVQTTYGNDICINLSWDGSRNGEYEPYVKHTYPLDSDLTLRGIPKLDANNKLYYDGDTYESDGKVTRKYGIVDLGTLKWNKNTDSAYYSSQITDFKRVLTVGAVQYGSAICSKYQFTQNISNATNGVISLYFNTSYSGNRVFVFDDFTGKTSAQVKSMLSGVYLVYELATPTEETADPYTKRQVVDDFGTEEFVVTEQSGVAVPVGHQTTYPVNLKAKLEMAPDSPSQGNGDYVVRHNNGENSYVLFSEASDLPEAPTTDGTYKLRVTVSDGTPTYSWVADS